MLYIYKIFPSDITYLEIKLKGILLVSELLNGDEIITMGNIVYEEKKKEEWNYKDIERKIKEYLSNKTLNFKSFELYY